MDAKYKLGLGGDVDRHGRHDDMNLQSLEGAVSIVPRDAAS